MSHRVAQISAPFCSVMRRTFLRCLSGGESLVVSQGHHFRGLSYQSSLVLVFCSTEMSHRVAQSLSLWFCDAKDVLTMLLWRRIIGG